MFKTIDIYLARTLIATTFITLLVLVGLSGLIKFVEQLKYLDRGSYDITLAFIYVVLSIPRDIEQFFPMATLIGGLIGMGLLASNSELVVMQSAGLSRFNIITSSMKSALLLMIFVMAMGEWVVPASESKAKQLRTQAFTEGSLISADKIVWAKDGDNFVSFGEISGDKLTDVTVFEFNQNRKLDRIIFAKSAEFQTNSWNLYQVKQRIFGPDSITVSESPVERWYSSHTPEKLGVAEVKPEALSIQGLQDYVKYMQNNSQDPSRYELAFWRKVFQPFTVAVMLLLAMSFIFGPLRSVTMSARIVMGVLTGFSFYIVSEVFGPLSLVYQLPPAAGAILPALSFTLLAWYLLRR